ncbi:MAG TPA: RodZ domain-containing protein [Anaerolineae bacterium]|nr:RodZ domain-containing protein [Anaerolineae bacterium]
MIGIGSRLREAREAHGLSIDDIQKATRIKRAFVEAIEVDRFEALPGPVQARGFIRSYANQVGLDPDELLMQFDGAPSGPAGHGPPGAATDGRSPAQAVRVRSMNLSRPEPEGETRPALPLPMPVLIIGAIVLFALGGLLIIRALAGEAPAPATTPLPKVVSSVSRTPEPTPALAASTRVSLTLTAGEHVWVRVTQDGVTAYEGMLEPEESRNWQGEQQIIVETGNGAALNVAVNGQPMGVLGPRNRVVVRAWGAQGEVTPAPTATPSTPTPEATSAATP